MGRAAPVVLGAAFCLRSQSYGGSKADKHWMGWEVVTEPKPKPATDRQRQLVHIGVAELHAHPEMVRLFSTEEAGRFIAICLAAKSRVKVAAAVEDKAEVLV